MRAIQIQHVIHEAVIDVDEGGTEAAAVVLAVSPSGAGPLPEPAAIVLDRPFFFLIRDVPTGALLFAGRVNDPTAHGGRATTHRGTIRGKHTGPTWHTTRQRHGFSERSR